MLRAALLWIVLAAPAALAAEPRRDFEPAPPVRLADSLGQEVDLPRAHEGVDVYLFWATWCPYCKALMPHLESLRLEFEGRVTVFALNFREDGDPMAFLEDNGLGFVLLPEADAVATAYGMRSTPGLVLVDGRGRIRFNLYDIVFEDPPDFEQLGHRVRAAHRAPFWAARIRQAVDALLAEGEPR